MRRPKPYIGITGFNDKLDILVAECEFKEKKKIYEDSNDKDSDRILMEGVLASLKTIYGKKYDTHPNRYPDLDKIRRVFSDSDSEAFKIIHYHTNKSEKLFVELALLHEIAGQYLVDGIQLNMVWPSPSEIAVYKTRYPVSKIILQVSEKALKKINWISGCTNEDFKYELKKYSGLVDYVLFDQSCGKGLLFSEDASLYQLLYQLRIARDALPNVGLVVAGGLGPKTVHFVRKLLKEFPDLSWDAETNVRDENDNLSLDKMSQYFDESFNVISTA